MDKKNALARYEVHDKCDKSLHVSKRTVVHWKRRLKELTAFLSDYC